MLDDKGNLILDSTQYPSQSENFSDREYFALQRDNKILVYIGPLVKGRITGKYSFTISSRIDGKNGEFLGLVLAAIETDDFTDFLRNIDIGKDSSVAVFHTNGALIRRQPMRDEFIGKSFAHLPLFEMPYDRSPSGVYKSSLIDGIPRFLSYRKIQDMPLLVVTGVPVDSVVEQWRTRLKIHSLLATFAFLVLLGLSLVVHKTTSREEQERTREVSSINESLEAEIIEHQRAEAALHHERDVLQTIMDSAGKAQLVYLDRDFNFVRVNETYATGCGYRPEQMIGKNHFALYPSPELEAIFAHVRDTGQDFEVRDRPFEYPDQPERGITYWDLTLKAVKGPDSAVTGLVFSLYETTQRKMAEEELRKAHDELELRVKERTVQLEEAYASLRREAEERERTQEVLRHSHKMEALSTMAGGIAHDFNNILAVILGFSEMAQEDVRDRPDVQHNLDNVIRSAMRAREMVKQILAFARKASYDRGPISLSVIVKETIQLLRASIPAMIEIKLSVTATSDTVLASPVEVQQILMNLATNASLAMEDKGGILEVKLSDIDFESDINVPGTNAAPGEYVELFVTDTGIGMAPDVMKKVFDPFFTTREVGKGTGMGLAVVYGIIKELNGAITVESVPGEGSTFRVILPKVKTNADARIVKSPEIVGGTEKILFVDDENMIVEWARITLERLGYKVTAVTDSTEALTIFSADPSLFDLVITDYAMPRIAGPELAANILALRNDIPIILCTGYSEAVSSDTIRQIGIREFLSKPLAKQELANTIRRVLDGNENQQGDFSRYGEDQWDNG